jgi:hypothetical protein
MSLARDDPLNPAEFMAEGFKKRKRGQVANLYKKQMTELSGANRKQNVGRNCQEAERSRERGGRMLYLCGC